MNKDHEPTGAGNGVVPPITRTVPRRCHVCLGAGKVRHVARIPSIDTCATCGGTGVIVEEEEKRT